MAPDITRRTANALMQLGAKARATARDPKPPKEAVPPADPRLEPEFTPLEEILGERQPAAARPVSSARPEPQLNLPTISGVANQMRYETPSLLPKPSSVIAPSHGAQQTNAVAVGLKAANWGRSEVDGWNYTILSHHPEARGVVRGEIGQGVGALKCNLFVYDALAAAGAAPNRIGGRVPSAHEWGDPGFSGIRDFAPVVTLTIPRGGLDKAMISSLHVGDIISDKEHVGLVSFRDGKPRTISAASMKAHPPIGGVIENDWGFRPGQTVTIRRYRPFGAIY